jgi:uncharacterized membrane protein
MTQLAPSSFAGTALVVSEQRRSRLRRFSRTLLWLCLVAAVIVVAVVFGPHVLHASHPGPTGGGV